MSSATSQTITAILGPTNTGKTFYAMERMLAHASGMIGFPLRLLARENYDRAVAQKGVSQVALITGEEKIMPPGARYLLCTVEAMPMDQRVDFLAVDEIQMCADPDRGHVFTDRLLQARGCHETLFLGAETMKPMISRLVPAAEFVTRPRMSALTCAGSKKINRLSPRSAVVAFTINDVYAIAELIRRQRGGAAVVLGALSPRTRNAQVAMYQAGEVDYLVATDAIGMGLNMDVRHVAFASTRKFDGKRFRQLTSEELAQIAGRAGRHTDDGTFGVTGHVQPLDIETVERMENHRFDDHRQIFWRNTDLALNTLDALKASLRMHADKDGMIRVREAADERALMELSRGAEIADSAVNRDGTALLWDVCQIPDFEKEWTIGHAQLLDQVYRHLRFGEGTLPTDWMAEHVNRIGRLDGDIDALSNRIARIRTWTYISHKANWVFDPVHWQGRTREIEDRLSDALHERLMQRFVDKRTAMLVSKLNTREDLTAAVRKDGDVLVEGQFIGQLVGLQFVADDVQFAADKKALSGAAARVLRQEINRRVTALCQQDEPALEWDDSGAILWMGETIASIRRGSDLLRPAIAIHHNDYIDGAGRERLSSLIDSWIQKEIGKTLSALLDLAVSQATGAARGILFQLTENLGSMSRRDALEQIDALGREDRKLLRGLGITIGRATVFMPALLKPAAITMRSRLWNLWHQPKKRCEAPKPGLITIDLTYSARPGDEESRFMDAMGYPVFRDAAGTFCVRMDMLERIGSKAWSLGLKGSFPMNEALMSFAGAGAERTTAILHGLGFTSKTKDDVRLFRLPRKKKAGKGLAMTKKKKSPAQEKNRQPRKNRHVIADSPFAVLKDLKV